MTELQLLNKDLKRLYRNINRLQPVDNFVFGSLYQTFEQYTALYFPLDNKIETVDENVIKEFRVKMAKEINELLKAVQVHYGDKLADLEIVEV